MNDEPYSAELFAQPLPAAPNSPAPGLTDLRKRLDRRRRGRRVLATSIVGALASCMVACVWVWRGTGDTGSASWQEVPTIAEVASAVPSDLRLPENSSGVQVFARIRRPIPVFGREGESEYVRHVGWIAPEELVPVDLSQFPLEQQKRIEAVLHDNQPKPTYVNL